ncbi:PLP-dependent transferase [Pluteus cervinus]|uniref:PLP-dependent transferase n=1 Tax=Pluteus cervinus TaxID=181527 RepID=A0ACD3AX37_9AGAR|nr:PLP-dependent transferase [Pluteus cervinus]
MSDEEQPPYTFSYYNNRHNAVASWFLGPRAENFDVLKDLFGIALEAQEVGRKSYFPHDPAFITAQIKATEDYDVGIRRTKFFVSELATRLTKSHVPFWNPRYNGHMNMDTTMPGIAAYIMTMIYNPNNVALEASPLTTAIEQKVGLQLCEMIGINTTDKSKPLGWGHITCGGTVANLESIWAARNLKFYPLSLILAMEDGGPLNYIRDSFKVTTCSGTTKLLKDFTTWELLNITPDAVLDIPDRLYEQYSMSPGFLQKAMNDYLVQTTPRDDDKFVNKFGRENINHIAYLASATMHYSWPKGLAVTGIASGNIIGLKVDNDARLDIKDLRKTLDQCLKEERAIYAVVAILGSTEHGACDPLGEIVKIRKEYQKKGLSFVLHADGAWGTYFHTTLNDPPATPIPVGGAPIVIPPPIGELPSGDIPDSTFVPTMALKPSTEDALKQLRYCESITIDPHKSGYLQYPAGGLLYRDGRMRYLVTWTSPVVFRNDVENMGVYGIEGSKPGAAPVGAFVSHEVIGLHKLGYGALLGEGVFSCVKMYSHLVTMSTPKTDFRVTTLNMLPAEESGGDVEDQKQFIRDRILDKRNIDLVKDTTAMQLVKKMGSDLCINAFAVNFRANGEINKDIVEANDLNTRIFERLSIKKESDDINKRPLIITSTQLSQSAYGSCLTTFKKRLGLVGNQDLYTLINVVSSPFPTEGNFSRTIADALETVIKEEVEISQFRNTLTPTFHGFVLQGTDKLYGTHLPMFNMADHRYQLIITGDLPADIMKKYVAARAANPGQFFTLGNVKPAKLLDMVNAGEFEAVIDKGLPPDDGSHFLSDFKLTNVRVIKNAPLDSKYLTTYPTKGIPFYLYGTQTQHHIDHILLASPNIQLTSDRVQLKLTRDGVPIDIYSEQFRAGVEIQHGPLVVHLVDYHENTMQPFPSNGQIAEAKSFFFKANEEYNVAVTVRLGATEVLAEGTMTLSDMVFIDTDMLNMNPMPDHHQHADSHVTHELRGSFGLYKKEETSLHHSLPLLKTPTLTYGQEWILQVEDIAERARSA